MLLLILSLGLLLLLGYGLWQQYSLGALLKMCWESIMTVRTILLTFMLIGMLTATWRACGTIPIIISTAIQFIDYNSFLMITFIINAAISFLIGTSFGTAATVGVICMSIAQALQLDSFWVAGAIVSGIYFGDRCSPVSTSALLVSTLTETELYENIKRMLKTCAVPFILTCAIYYFFGGAGQGDAASIDVVSVFAKGFVLNTWCALPAIAILALALMRIEVKKTMGFSILLAIGIALTIQNVSCWQMAKLLVIGYEAPNPELGKLLNGGGLLSMVNVFGIVCIASCYSGVCKGTGLLNNVQEKIMLLGNSLGTFLTILLTSIVMGMLACNQSLNIMLTHQLCKGLDISKEELAIDIEDTAVLVSPLIPWNIAGAVPLAIVGASSGSLLVACFPYLVPLWRLVMEKFCTQAKASCS